MREDQRIRLRELAEKLADVVIQDIDPDNWSSNGITLVDMDREQRGDAQWCRKTAVQSVALLARVELLVQDPERLPWQQPADDPQAEIERAEKAANAAVKRVMDRASQRGTV